MELLYKKFLLSKIQSNSGIFYQEPCVYYLNDLGIEVSDFYEAYPILMNLNDDEYCGEGFGEKGKYSHRGKAARVMYELIKKEIEK